jgi:Recombination endonuclease VII
MKFCRDCGDYRPISDFTKNARSRDGLAFYCRTHLSERALRSREARRTKPRVNRRPPDGLVIPPGCKWCGDCAQVKPLGEFVRTRAASSGFGSYCLPCHAVRCRANADKRGGYRTYHLSRRYGITAEEADHLLAGQGGMCAICKTAPANHVDHDHATGAVRALLCFNCNGGLGQFRDDPHVLRAAAEYVEFHRLSRFVLAAAAAAGLGPVRAVRPGEPPVGSQRRPGARGTSTRSTGRNSGARRRTQAGEVDG